MNKELFYQLAHQASFWCDQNIPEQFSEEIMGYGEAWEEKFAELIVKECAKLARDTDLEDVEGGDSEVLRAAKRQILEHFGVE